MANHWATYEINQTEEGRELRLDPCHLPQTITYQTAQSGKKLHCTLGERAIILRTGAAEAREDILKILSPRQFRGIAAKRVKTRSGEQAIVLVLLHDNPDYCVPLLHSGDHDDVLLDWRLWADAYDLPMMTINVSGVASTILGHSPLQSFFFSPAQRRGSRFLLRCRGRSLNMRLVIANQVMLG
ncbi:MAG: Hypothetical protein BHV28_15570 [Candidatus Tokpelaia hoelldobleri]|uniref:Uncharacterized protein n=1 Tax=Candidatus Tokpelaia hoelldobleri TaxID=1902579 RepID=A0A1U9JWI1_9HYPH|nr:MAG: Hypothetical protein BHV28_15570 [Candidatus Tokpelaia hoelldoblerii]